jgi:3',5'-cyclic AMP phosphodiesterase CpdA
MRTILHFSDIHFGGPQAPNWADAMLSQIERIQPTVVAISGDLTQRARTAQFQAARRFLDRISSPLIVVPGNHDVPLWNVFDRFMSPREKYRRWITDDLNPVYMDDEIVVMGIDTTRSFTIKGGHIGSDDLRAVQARICALSEDVLKVLVGHHPLVQPPGFEHEDVVGGVDRALKLFAQCGVDMVLTGHLHQSHVTSAGNILLVQAGTAASLRGRGEEVMKNSFNLIEVTRPEIRVTHYIYSDSKSQFVASTVHTWQRPSPPASRNDDSTPSS